MGSDTIISLVVGVILGAAGLALSLWIYRRGGSARTRVTISFEEVTRIDPTRLGIDLTVRVGSRSVPCVIVFDVNVENHGPRDLWISDADDPEIQATRPRIHLPSGLRAIADPWSIDGSHARSDVRVARERDGNSGTQLLHVHVHRIASKESARVRVLCTSDYELGDGAIRPIGFFRGYLPDVTLSGDGLLRGVAEPDGHSKRAMLRPS